MMFHIMLDGELREPWNRNKVVYLKEEALKKLALDIVKFPEFEYKKLSLDEVPS